jgi:hypothetical protein
MPKIVRPITRNFYDDLREAGVTQAMAAEVAGVSLKWAQRRDDDLAERHA